MDANQKRAFYEAIFEDGYIDDEGQVRKEAVEL